MALKTKRYNSAPIREAVIEIRLQPIPPVPQDELKKVALSLNADFPNQADMQFLEMGIANQPGQMLQQKLSQSVVGVRLSKPDDSRVLQLRNDGFAYSHMAPYTDWETFKGEALPLWQRYRAVRPEAKLARCALRYINRIDIPDTKIEPHDYFELYPKVPLALPQQDVIGMSLNLQMPQQDLECVANVAQALGEPVKAGYISLILDIDIFRLQIEDWDDDATWAFLDKLRGRKNEIFEACITDRTRELIDK
ncbi:MAG: TIGR04255 family protein [Burkholderiales bacterium]